MQQTKDDMAGAEANDCLDEPDTLQHSSMQVMWDLQLAWVAVLLLVDKLSEVHIFAINFHGNNGQVLREKPCKQYVPNKWSVSALC